MKKRKVFPKEEMEPSKEEEKEGEYKEKIKPDDKLKQKKK